MASTCTIKIEPGDRKLLKLYQVENDLPTLSAAIRHAIAAINGVENGPVPPIPN